MRNKKGFTLVELLAVIAILAILVLLALPNIIELFNNARRNTFLNEIKIIYNETTKKYLTESLKGNKINIISSKDNSKLNITGEEMDYCILLNSKGEVDKLAVGNNNFHIIANEIDSVESLKIEDILEGKLEDMNCETNNFEVKINCFYDGNLVQGAEYINGQYTYKYMQEKISETYWNKINTNGWGVALTNTTSTDPITSTLCTTINDKPIVSMSYMFYKSQATTIDLSSFNTSNVINMESMFSNSKLNLLDLSNFDTSNVSSMQYMFYNNEATILDLSNFNTSKVNTMYGMFYNNKSSVLDLSNFNTSNVTNMGSMFYGTVANILDLSNFDTSNVTTMFRMFYNNKSTILDLSNFDTSNVRDMNSMFYNSQVPILNLSSFNTSNVTDMGSMFNKCKATTGYARTQAEANSFNSLNGKPKELNFTIIINLNK